MKTIHRLKQFINHKLISLNAFDNTIAAATGYIGKTIKNEGSIGSDVLEKIFCAFPELNPVWLLTGVGNMILENGNTPLQLAEKNTENSTILEIPPPNKTNIVTDFVTPTVTPPLSNTAKGGNYAAHLHPVSGSFIHESKPVYNLGLPRVITVNERQQENIIYVPVKARAGYLNGYGDPEYIQSLATYRLPGLDNGTYRMFEAEGPSMAPNIMSGDRLIGQWVNSLSEIRENRVYVIVSASGIVVKRVLNRANERGKIVLKSDTTKDRREYPTTELDVSEIKEMWYCRLKLSADFSEPAEVFHRLNNIEGEMTDLRASNAALNATMQQILTRLPAL